MHEVVPADPQWVVPSNCELSPLVGRGWSGLHGATYPPPMPAFPPRPADPPTPWARDETEIRREMKGSSFLIETGTREIEFFLRFHAHVLLTGITERYNFPAAGPPEPQAVAVVE